MPITGYNIYIFAFAPDIQYQIIHIFGIMLGLLLIFSDIDRNVYRKRLVNLRQQLADKQIHVERDEYLTYRVGDNQDNM